MPPESALAQSVGERQLLGRDTKCACPGRAPVWIAAPISKHHFLYTKTEALFPWQQAQEGTVGVIPYTKPSVIPLHCSSLPSNCLPLAAAFIAPEGAIQSGEQG